MPLKTLKKWNVRIRKTFVQSRFDVVDDQADGHYVIYEASIGWYIMRVETLNLRGKAQSMKTEFGKGSFGVVFPGQYQS